MLVLHHKILPLIPGAVSLRSSKGICSFIFMISLQPLLSFMIQVGMGYTYPFTSRFQSSLGDITVCFTDTPQSWEGRIPSALINSTSKGKNLTLCYVGHKWLKLMMKWILWKINILSKFHENLLAPLFSFLF